LCVYVTCSLSWNIFFFSSEEKTVEMIMYCSIPHDVGDISLFVCVQWLPVCLLASQQSRKQSVPFCPIYLLPVSLGQEIFLIKTKTFKKVRKVKKKKE